MKYYFKFSNRFLLGIVTPILWLFICWLHVIRSLVNNTQGFDLYFYLCCGVIWILKALVDFPGLYTTISLAFKKQPLLEANESYLYDHVSGVKFYWDDIEEISNDEYVLLLKIYEPSKYLEQLRRPIDRFYSYSKKKKVFKISLDYIKADLKNLGETLNNFSIQTLVIQDGKR